MAQNSDKEKIDPATRSYLEGVGFLKKHPLFLPLMARAELVRQKDRSLCPASGWAVVTNHGTIHVHPTRRAEAAEWVYVIGHCLLHLGFGHFKQERRALEWNAACDVVVTRFLREMKLGRAPDDFISGDLPGTDEVRLYDLFCSEGIPKELAGLSVGGDERLDLFYAQNARYGTNPKEWQASFAAGLRNAVTSAIDVAAGRLPSFTAEKPLTSKAQRARSWFMSSYPLLGGMIAAFEIVEDSEICQREGISVAAVNAYTKELYINPGIGLTEWECRFVMAHEVLHVGLAHQERCDGRDAYLWNVACDFVVNGWLVEMGVGTLPHIGALYDPELKGLSAETVYDRMVTDMRRFRKLATMRGVGLGEMMGEPGCGGHGKTEDLDGFYRNALSRGLEYHIADGRGLLPAGLVEAIRALSQPAVPWDVELARWFDEWFEPVEKVRSYARPSRRQGSTPDIPRPSWVAREGALDGRTFGVVLDTSGSMDRVLLAKALGAIASYSLTHEVPMVRVVFCDAATYDQGYMSPDAICGRVQVKGRGGTVLQPGVDLLEKAEDFPKDGPLMVITDGFCDKLNIRRDHCLVVPKSARLPFTPRGPVFRVV
jgi:predicted metal-dependent peptidase